ncbi:hypothetical protein E2320_017212 [Naja naja]|nr:hypothetical protein E2320_017212 [Naja naja]
MPFVHVKSEFFMPGLVDAHIHAPQYSFTGIRGNMTLLKWLEKTTYPVEAEFKKIDFAEEVYTRAVRRTLKNGTTTACYFATIHTDAALLLADIIASKHLCQASLSLSSLEKRSPEELMQIRDSHPHLTDTEKTQRFVQGILGKKTIMAHGCYLSDEELDIFKRRGAAIIHCPNSNISLKSGLLNTRKILNNNVKLGLGTDVAGGYSVSMLDAIRNTIVVSEVLHLNSETDEKGLTLKEAFRLATLAGSQALGLDHITGNFEVGKEFDALLINAKASDSPFDLFASDHIEDIIEKFLYLGDDRNIEGVYVAGKLVVPFSSSV